MSSVLAAMVNSTEKLTKHNWPTCTQHRTKNSQEVANSKKNSATIYWAISDGNSVPHTVPHLTRSSPSTLDPHSLKKFNGSQRESFIHVPECVSGDPSVQHVSMLPLPL